MCLLGSPGEQPAWSTPASHPVRKAAIRRKRTYNSLAWPWNWRTHGRRLAKGEAARVSKMCWRDMQLNAFFLLSEQAAWSGCSFRWAQTECCISSLQPACAKAS
eukprot:6207255-Pleurochrysis_carterae.AAC.1